MVAGRAAAISAGVYSVSSNRAGPGAFGGCGWIIDPDGEVLARTTEDEPFATVALDLRCADWAKRRYPRNLVGPAACAPAA